MSAAASGRLAARSQLWIWLGGALGATTLSPLLCVLFGLLLASALPARASPGDWALPLAVVVASALGAAGGGLVTAGRWRRRTLAGATGAALCADAVGVGLALHALSRLAW